MSQRLCWPLPSQFCRKAQAVYLLHLDPPLLCRAFWPKSIATSLQFTESCLLVSLPSFCWASMQYCEVLTRRIIKLLMHLLCQFYRTCVVDFPKVQVWQLARNHYQRCSMWTHCVAVAKATSCLLLQCSFSGQTRCVRSVRWSFSSIQSRSKKKRNVSIR